MQIAIFAIFLQNHLFSVGDKNTVFQKHRSHNPDPWLFLQGSGRGQPRLVGGGGVLGRKGVGLQAALGARPTSGATRLYIL